MVTKFLVAFFLCALLTNSTATAREIKSAEEALRLGDAALLNGLTEKGRTFYLRAAELKPKDAAPVMRLALLAYESSDYGSARKFMETAGSLRKDKPTQKSLNALLQKMDEANAALMQIENAISAGDEKALVAGHAKAIEIMSRAPVLMAVLAPHLRYLLKKDPDNIRFLAALAEGYYLSSDSMHAYTYYKKLAERSLPQLTLYRRYGDVAVNVGAFDDARWAYKKALRQAVYNKDRVSAAEMEKMVRKLPLFSDKIDVYIKDKDYSEAFKELRKYLSRNVSHPWAVLQMARLYAEMGRMGQAEKLYRQALEWRPEDPSAHFAMAHYYLYQKKEFEKALAEYQLARVLLAEEAQLNADKKREKKSKKIFWKRHAPSLTFTWKFWIARSPLFPS